MKSGCAGQTQPGAFQPAGVGLKPPLWVPAAAHASSSCTLPTAHLPLTRSSPRPGAAPVGVGPNWLPTYEQLGRLCRARKVRPMVLYDSPSAIMQDNYDAYTPDYMDFNLKHATIGLLYNGRVGLEVDEIAYYLLGFKLVPGGEEGDVADRLPDRLRRMLNKGSGPGGPFIKVGSRPAYYGLKDWGQLPLTMPHSLITALKRVWAFPWRHPVRRSAQAGAPERLLARDL